MAMERAIEKAAAVGVGMATVRNSTHFGPSFYYACQALPHDMLGIAMTTAGNIVTPPGGIGRTLGSNTIAFAAPAREAPLGLDTAWRVVVGGKFEIARRRGKTVPSGWGTGPEGKPIESDPSPYFEGGAILPLGGDVEHGAWKGFGLAVMSDVLSGVLSAG